VLHSVCVKNTTAEHPSTHPVLEQGQIWELNGSNLQIGIVGKRLVHYKHFAGKAKRANNSLASIPVLEKYLSDNNAVLQSK
jgi:hypothetical protein